MVQIIYKTSNFLVLNKPAGILVHPVKPCHIALVETSLSDWLLKNFPQVRNVGEDAQRPGIVHRLDKDVSGVLLVALNQEAFEYFKGLFQAGKIKKTYLALVYGKTDLKGEIKSDIGLKKGTIKRTVHLKKAKLIKKAITLYKRIKYFRYQNQDFSLLKIFPLTGRTHQIRIHLSSIGYPIFSDSKYGRRGKELVAIAITSFDLKRPFLHALSLEFSYGKTRYKFEAELPVELSRILTKLNFKDKLIY